MYGHVDNRVHPVTTDLLCAGPGFTLTFALGNCTFDEKQLLSKDGAIECVGPSVTLDKTPATFTSAYQSAAKFVGEVIPTALESRSPTSAVILPGSPPMLVDRDIFNIVSPIEVF